MPINGTIVAKLIVCMDISLSKTLFAATPKPQTAKSADTSSKINIGEIETTDNIQPIAQNKPVAEVSEENFSHTLAKKIAAKESSTENSDANTENQDEDSETLNPDGTFIPQELLTPPLAQNISVDLKVDNQLVEDISANETASHLTGTEINKNTNSNTAEVPEQINIQASEKAAQQLVESESTQTITLVGETAVKPDIVSTPDNIPISEDLTAELENTQNAAATVADIQGEDVETEPDNKIPVIQTYSDDNQIINDSETEPDNKIPVIQTYSDDNQIINDSEEAIRIIKQTEQSDAKTTLSDKPIIPAPESNKGNAEETVSETKISSEPTILNKPEAADNSKAGFADTKFAETDKQPTLQKQAAASQGSPIEPLEKTTQSDANQGKTKFGSRGEDNKLHIENISVEPKEQKINQSQLQHTSAKTDNSDELSLKQSSISDGQMGNEVTAGNNIQSAIAEQSTAPAASAKHTDNADAAESVRKQIQESIHTSFRSDGREIVIRLNPPELGKVAIKFVQQSDGVTGLLQVDNLQTRNQIQQELPDIIQHLQESGILIKKIEVVLNQQEQHTLKDQSTSGQNNWSGHQSSPNPESQRNNNFYGEPTRYADYSTEYMETSGQLTDKSINVLV